MLARWVERDLIAACAAGEHSPAFGVEETIARAEDLLGSERHVILTGDSGVGKTAIVYAR